MTELDWVHFYLQRQQELIDYPFFQKRGYPIGSGCVESGHKVVVQQRLKGAGMRWAEEYVNPLLALRDLVCNGRWQTGWQDSVTYPEDVRRAWRPADAQPWKQNIWPSQESHRWSYQKKCRTHPI